MINTLWTYGIPCVVTLLAFGAVMSLSDRAPKGRRRAPRGYRPPAPAPAALVRAPVQVWRVPPKRMTDAEVEEFELRFKASASKPPVFLDGPIETPGASLLEGGMGDAVRVPDSVATLDRDPDSPEAWLARWTADYRAERPTPPPERSDAEFIRDTDIALRVVQRRCLDVAARLTSAAEAGIFDWRIGTDTGRLPVIDGPAADRLAESLLSS
jgi:hypothetical protein